MTCDLLYYGNHPDLHSFPTRRSSDLVYSLFAGTVNHQTAIRVGTAPTGEGSRVVTVVPIASEEDRKSTRLNSSHPSTSYAVFCLQKNTITPIIKGQLIKNRAEGWNPL